MHPPGRSLLPTLLLAGAGLSWLAGSTNGAAGETAQAGNALTPAYRDSARRLCNDAVDAFRARLSGPDVREARFGLAASLLNAQPRTDAKVAEAAALLAEVVGGNPDDELGIDATYLQARVAQFHRRPAEPAAASQLYESLYRKHPDHPLAQMAAVKWWTLRLYDPAASTEARRAAFSEAEALAPKLTDAGARRDLHSLLAAACDRFGYGDETRLEHLLAQEAAGVARPDLRLDVTLSIAETARRAGQADVAAAHYRAFLALAPRDYRRYSVEQRLAQFSALTPP